MKVYNLHAIGDIRYEDREKPQLKKGWAMIKVKAAGVCSSDIPRVYTKGTYHFPTIPGHEFSGVVEDVYEETDAHWIGERVGIFPLIPCRECAQCLKGKYEMCNNYDYVGSRRDGGFAEYVAVPIWNLIKLDEDISFAAAATMEPFAVAYHAVKQAEIEEGDNVAIIGSGMIGFAAAQWAQFKGAGKVYVIGRSDEKRKIAERIKGIEYICDTKDAGLVCNKVIEAVGAVKTIASAIDLVEPGGKVVLMGNPEGDIELEQNVYWKILRKQIMLVGTWNSSYESGAQSDWTEVLKGLREKAINPELLITDYYDQTDLAEAFDMMRKHERPYCKVMILWNKEE